MIFLIKIKFILFFKNLKLIYYMGSDSIFPLVGYETIREYKLLNDWIWYYYSYLLFGIINNY